MVDKSVPYMPVTMIKHDTDSFTRMALPAGFRTMWYRPGFMRFWSQIIFLTGEQPSFEQASELFSNKFLPHEEELRKRCLFILNNMGCPVATGMLWPSDEFGQRRERLHWISVVPTQQGFGLGKFIVSRLLELFFEMGGGPFVFLNTNTQSYRAIGMYKKFGFLPYLGEKPASLSCSDEEYEKNRGRAWTIIEDKLSLYHKV